MKMKTYLTSLSLSPFLLSLFYTYVPLSFSLSIYIYICVSLFFSGFAFHRPLILIFIFFWCRVSPTGNFIFFLSFWVHLQISYCSPVFHVVSRRKNIHTFLSFSGLLFFPYELARGRQFILCSTDMSVSYGISRPTDLSDFSSLQIRPSRCLVSCGLLGQSAFSLQKGRLLLGAACQFLHSYYD